MVTPRVTTLTSIASGVNDTTSTQQVKDTEKPPVNSSEQKTSPPSSPPETNFPDPTFQV